MTFSRKNKEADCSQEVLWIGENPPAPGLFILFAMFLSFMPYDMLEG